VNFVTPPGTDAHSSTSLYIASCARRLFTPASVAQPFVAMVALTDRAFGGSGGVGSGGDAAHAASSKASAMNDRRVMDLDNTLALLTLSVVCPRP
jgi:hypothetical protein